MMDDADKNVCYWSSMRMYMYVHVNVVHVRGIKLPQTLPLIIKTLRRWGNYFMKNSHSKYIAYG